MGTIVERIREVCKEKKVAIYRLEKDLGYGNGYLNPKKATSVTANIYTHSDDATIEMARCLIDA